MNQFHSKQDMDDHFSQLQKELHLPSETNTNRHSPENKIISKYTPSVYRYGWESTHEIELDVEENDEKEDGRSSFIVPKRYSKLCNLRFLTKIEDVESVTMFFIEEDGEERELQSFDRCLVEYFGLMSLPWFFNDPRNAVDMFRINGDCLRVVIKHKTPGKIKACATYGTISNNEGFHNIRSPAAPPVMAEIWVPYKETIECDHYLSVLIFGDGETINNKILIRQDYMTFVDCNGEFVSDRLEECTFRWDNYSGGRGVRAGVPSHMPLIVEAGGQWTGYIKIVKLLSLY